MNKRLLLLIGLIGLVGCPKRDNDDNAVEFFSAGIFAPLAGYEASTATGAALVTRLTDGTTAVSVKVSGLAANTVYPAHLHVQPCAYSAGGHYKINPAVTTTEASNEVWPSFTTDPNGNGLGSIVSSHSVRSA